MPGLMAVEDETPLLECEPPLHQAARQATGYSEFGSDEYREGLRVLLQACDEESNLTPAGRLMVKSHSTPPPSGVREVPNRAR